jgi:hypothetical protein
MIESGSLKSPNSGASAAASSFEVIKVAQRGVQSASSNDADRDEPIDWG